MKEKAFDLEQLNSIADDIISRSQEKLIAFRGDLGAGKTTLIKALIRSLGIRSQGSSPSFSLVNLYENEQVRVYHCDLYRLESYEEALDIGLEDYLADEDSWCFIEWPEIVEFLLPRPYQLIKLRQNKDGQHYINMELVK